MGFYILLAHWIWFGRGIQETILLFLFLLHIIFCGRKKITTQMSIELLLLLLLIVTMAYSTLKGSSHNYLVQDLKSMIGGIVTLLFFCSSFSSVPSQFENGIKKFSKALFFYAWINIVIILLQSLFPGFLMNSTAIRSVGSSTTHYDQFTGFIGINGTTRWNLFTCFITLLYFYTNDYPKNTKKHKRQTIISILFKQILILMVYQNYHLINIKTLIIIIPKSCQ